MATGKHLMTDDEIWGESGLVDSWNDALAEYKKYHSIYARGGTMDDIAIVQRNRKSEACQIAHQKSHPHEDDPSSVKMDAQSNDQRKLSRGGLAEQQGKREVVITEDEFAATTAEPHGPRLPATGPELGPTGVLGSVHDESLKKLLMSWYYAGYYTGLYQGQQQQIQ